MSNYGDMFTDFETDAMIELVDLDGDGIVDYMEYDDFIKNDQDGLDKYLKKRNVGEK